eukprot:4114548-Prymnesium_polylepis.1
MARAAAGTATGESAECSGAARKWRSAAVDFSSAAHDCDMTKPAGRCVAACYGTELQASL